MWQLLLKLNLPFQETKTRGSRTEAARKGSGKHDPRTEAGREAAATEAAGRVRPEERPGHVRRDDAGRRNRRHDAQHEGGLCRAVGRHRQEAVQLQERSRVCGLSGRSGHEAVCRL